MSEIDIVEIMNTLPHRYPFILVDKVIQVHPNEKIIAVKNVTINEPFFNGHFPGQPVMPGVLMLEALAQAGVLLAFNSTGEYNPGPNKTHLFAGVDKARFKRVVRPGDQLQLEVSFTSIRRGIWKIHGVASVDGEVACKADLMSAVTGDL